MRIPGKFREVKISSPNANNEIVDNYYMIPEHTEAEENEQQMMKQFMIIGGIGRYNTEEE